MHCGLFVRRPARLGALTALALAAVLSACGGGGGGDDNPPPVGDIDVTAANQDALSRAALVAVQGGLAGDALGLASGGPFGASPAGPRGSASALDAIVRALTPRVRAAGVGRERVAAAPVVENCFVSGSTTTTLDDRDASGTATVGDVVTVVFNACNDGANEVVNGSLATMLTEVVASPFGFTASVTMSGYSAASTVSVRSVSYTGAFTLTYSESSASTATTQIRVTSPLAVQVVHPMFSDTVTLQADFSVRSNYELATPPGAGFGGRTTTEASGHVVSVAAGGSVFVWSQAPHIEWWDVEPHPRSGQVLVQGLRGRLLLTILSAASVRLELDANDDAVFETSKDLPWDQLA